VRGGDGEMKSEIRNHKSRQKERKYKYEKKWTDDLVVCLEFLVRKNMFTNPKHIYVLKIQRFNDKTVRYLGFNPISHGQCNIHTM
jgi:hypothetical protein